MRCLIQLETNDDPISACRLMNIFRRKGLKLEALGMSQQSGGLCLLVLVEFVESELGHVLNFLRRTEGVLSVNCYRQTAAEASLVLVDAEGQGALEIIRRFPGCKLIFSSFGKYLIEVPPGRALPEGGAGLQCYPFARVKDGEDVTRPETAEKVGVR